MSANLPSQAPILPPVFPGFAQKTGANRLRQSKFLTPQRMRSQHMVMASSQHLAISTYPHAGTETSTLITSHSSPIFQHTPTRGRKLNAVIVQLFKQDFNIPPRGDGNPKLTPYLLMEPNFNIPPRGDGNLSYQSNISRRLPFQHTPTRGRKRIGRAESPAVDRIATHPHAGTETPQIPDPSRRLRRFQHTPTRGRKHHLTALPAARPGFQHTPTRGRKLNPCNGLIIGECISTYPHAGTETQQT